MTDGSSTGPLHATNALDGRPLGKAEVARVTVFVTKPRENKKKKKFMALRVNTDGYGYPTISTLDMDQWELTAWRVSG